MAQIAGLARETLAIYARAWGSLMLWYAAGYLGLLLGRQGAARLGAGQQTLAALVFAAGLIFAACALLMMIAEAGRLLPWADQARRRTLTILLTLVGPLLAIWSVWDVVAQEVRLLYVTNILVHGLFDSAQWSVRQNDVGFLIGGAALAWLVRLAFGLIRRVREARDPQLDSPLSRALTVPVIYLEGLWVFFVFLAGFAATSSLLAWWSKRAVVGWTYDAWVAATDSLPSLGIDLPERIRDVVGWVLGTLIPQAWDLVAMPLVYLAVSALVLGWSPSRAVLPTRLRGVAERVSSATAPRVRRGIGILTDDLRQRVEPLWSALTLLLRSGPRLLGAFLVLAGCAVVLHTGLTALLWHLVGARPVEQAVVADQVIELVAGVLGTPLLVSLYVATLHRARTAEQTRPSTEAAVSPVSG